MDPDQPVHPRPQPHPCLGPGLLGDITPAHPQPRGPLVLRLGLSHRGVHVRFPLRSVLHLLHAHLRGGGEVIPHRRRRCLQQSLAALRLLLITHGVLLPIPSASVTVSMM